MHSSCPSIVEEQLDFFGMPLNCARRLVAPMVEDRASTDSETPTQLSARVPTRIRNPQLSLRLPRVALNDLTWTDEQLLAFRDGVLVAQLHLLNDERTTRELRTEIIAWIAAPKQKTEDLKKNPLSFQACCLSAGVDFEEMREQTLFIVAPDLIPYLD